MIDASNQMVLGGILSTSYPGIKIPGSYVGINGVYNPASGNVLDVSGNTKVNGTLVVNNINTDASANDLNLGLNLTTGDIYLGGNGSSVTNVALNWGGGSNSGVLTFDGGSFNLNSTGDYTQKSGATYSTNISTNQTTGIMNIGTSTIRSGAININTGATATAPLNISSLTTVNAPITIGSTGSTTQTCDMNAITTFSKIPSCSINPTSSYNLCNKNYVDSAVGGNSTLGTNNTWTGTNTFGNTAAGSLTSAAAQPVPSDNSTKIPTTAWVQSAIATVGSTQWTTSGSNIYYNSTGNVGIGTTPSSTLDVSGNARIRGRTYFGIDNPGGGSNDTAYMEYLAISGEQTTLRINVQNDTNDNINLNPTGNVGINTDTPAYKLDVTGTLRTTGLITANAGLTVAGNVGIGTTTPAYQLSLGTTSGFYKLAVYDGGTSNFYGLGAINGNLTFGAGITTSTNPQMVLSTLGNVGIGTITPGYTLDVSGVLHTTMDASINMLTVGKGGGNVSTNTAFGFQTLSKNINGTSNVAIGYGSLQYNTGGSNNTAIGCATLQLNTNGSNNTAIGYQALLSNKSGNYNMGIGYNAGVDLQGNSNYNTFLGNNANVSVFSNIYNNSTAIGYNAIIDASNQIVLGGLLSNYYPGIKIPGSYVSINGVYNPASGYVLDVNGNVRFSNGGLTSSGLITASGGIYTNTITSATGGLTVSGLITASNGLTASGLITANNGLTANTLTATGLITATTLTASGLITANNGLTATGLITANNGLTASGLITANTLTASGLITANSGLTVSGVLNTNADALINGINVGLGGGNISTNTAVGYLPLLQNTSGSRNVGIGYQPLYSNATGGKNVGVGYQTLFRNITGGSNIAINSSALYNNTDGSFNIGIGESSLSANTIGSYNIGIGQNSLGANTIGQYNTAIGSGSLGAGSILRGNSNYNTFLGANTNVLSNTSIYNNSTAIGYNAIIDASNQMVLGGLLNSSYPGIKIPGSYVGINGVYNPTSGYALDVSGNTNVSGISYFYTKPNSTPYSIVTNAPIQIISVGDIYDKLILTAGNTNNSAGTIQYVWDTDTSSNILYRQLQLNPYGGSVFINKLSPDPGTNSYALDVNGSINSSGGGSQSFIAFQNLGYFYGMGTINSALCFSAQQPLNDAIPQMVLTSDSNVGIGITNPAYQLSLGTTNSFYKLALYDGGTSNFFGLGAIADNLTFGAGITTSGTPQMVLSSLGRVGIGTTTPGYTLDVSGNVRFTSGDTWETQINIINTSLTPAAGYQLLVGGSGNNTGQAGVGGFGIFSTVNGFVFNINSNSNVGIGTTNPQTKLEVIGTVNATSYNSPSDYRIKKDVVTLDETFTVDKLRPVTYNNTKLDKQDVGLIAHELQEVYPFLVNGEKDGENLQSVNYTGLIAILIKEIQELKERVKKLEGK
jgi:hypothetical protein